MELRGYFTCIDLNSTSVVSILVFTHTMDERMYDGRMVFSQLMDNVPKREFRRCVDRYGGNYRVRTFTCWDQFLCMAFAQLTCRESLRDIEACLRSLPDKLYHMGIRGKVSRNTLAVANEKRDWRIYADFAQVLIHEARRLYADESFGVELDETVYALGFDNDRSVSFALPMGTVPKDKRGRQNAYSFGPSGQYPRFCNGYAC